LDIYSQKTKKEVLLDFGRDYQLGVRYYTAFWRLFFLRESSRMHRTAVIVENIPKNAPNVIKFIPRLAPASDVINQFIPVTSMANPTIASATMNGAAIKRTQFLSDPIRFDDVIFAS
jgi:hypothetical protein